MAMNVNVVNATKNLKGGKDGGFVDTRATTTPIVKEITRQHENLIRQQRIDKRYADQLARSKAEKEETRVRNLIDKMPTPDISKVNEKDRPALNAEIQRIRQEYGINANIVATADPSSPEYIEAKATLDGAMNILSNYESNFTNKKNEDEQYLADLDNGLISEAVSPEDKAIIARVRGGTYDNTTIIDGIRHYSWTDEDTGEIVTVNEKEIPNYWLENAEAGTAYVDMWTKATTAANKYGTPHDDETTQIKLAQLYKKVGREGIQSMAYDDIGSTGESFAEKWDREHPNDPMDWRAPENEELLKQELSKYLSETMQSVVEKNIKAYNTRKANNPNVGANAQARIDDWNNQTALIETNPDYVIPGYGAGSKIDAVPVEGGYVIKFNSQSTLQGTYPDSYMKDNKPIIFSLEEAKQILKY